MASFITFTMTSASAKTETNQRVIHTKPQKESIVAQPEKGDKGSLGEPGEPGIKGLAGDRGIVGIKGEKGNVGAKGNRGEQGVHGAIGERGEKGDKGMLGPQGDQGLGLSLFNETACLNYDVGDCIIFDDVIYLVISPIQSIDNPSVATGNYISLPRLHQLSLDAQKSAEIAIQRLKNMGEIREARK